MCSIAPHLHIRASTSRNYDSCHDYVSSARGNGRSLLSEEHATYDASLILNPPIFFPFESRNMEEIPRSEIVEIDNPAHVSSSRGNHSATDTPLGRVEFVLDDKCQQTRRGYLRYNVMDEYRDTDFANSRYRNSATNKN